MHGLWCWIWIYWSVLFSYIYNYTPANGNSGAWNNDSNTQHEYYYLRFPSTQMLRVPGTGLMIHIDREATARSSKHVLPTELRTVIVRAKICKSNLVTLHKYFRAFFCLNTWAPLCYFHPWNQKFIFSHTFVQYSRYNDFVITKS